MCECMWDRLVCVRAAVDLFEQIKRVRPVKEDNVIFSGPEERLCNTICSLNGARQRVRGWSRITTAAVLPETTVGVCVSSLHFHLLLCASHV